MEVTTFIATGPYSRDSLLGDGCRDIPGYLGLYMVSASGTVYSVNRQYENRLGHKHRRRGKKICHMVDRCGYIYVRLCKEGKERTHRVHQLILKSFGITRHHNHEQVNHKNGNKQDNRIENLEWCTRSENQQHYRNVLDKGKYNRGSKLSDNDVLSIHRMFICGLEYTEIAAYYGVSYDLILRILKGKVHPHLHKDYSDKINQEKKRRIKCGQMPKNTLIA